MKEKNDSKKRLRLFDPNRDGKGISKKGADTGFGFKRFFITFKNNFSKLLTVNIIMVLGNFPILFLIATLSGYTKVDGFLPMSDLFQNLAAFFAIEEPTGAGMTLYAIEGIQNQVLIPTTLTYVFYGISAITLFTFGVVNAGTAYVLRNIAMGEPVFVFSDFVYAVKRNWKQALPFGIIDVLINVILIFNIYNMFMSGTPDFLSSLMLWSNIIILLLYFFMRYYIYVQMVTFKLSVFKILKNSLIFSLLGAKRNFVALGGIILGILIEIALVASQFLLPFAVAAPLVLLFSLFAYMKVFAAYYKIKTVMIDPYKAEHPDPVEDEPEIIMTDDVTERERLEEIKKRNGLA